MILAESEDGLLLDTVQVYTPPVVTFRVCVYCAVSGSSNTVSIPSVTVVESLVQVTVVAGPPVEIQVRVSWSELNTTPPDIVMSPIDIEKYSCMLAGKKTFHFLGLFVQVAKGITYFVTSSEVQSHIDCLSH